MLKAIEILLAYVAAFGIDVFAIPAQDSRNLLVMIVSIDSMINAIKAGYCTIDPNEDYARMGRKMTVTAIAPLFKPLAIYRTSYKRYGDIPKHAGQLARGFEKVVTETLNTYGDNAIHTGDNKTDTDVLSEKWKKIECKTGRGELRTASK